jgi:hypothetical protein
MLFRKPARDVFEIHLTVETNSADLEALAAKLGLKFVRIELSRGVYANQPMLTGTVRGDLKAAVKAVASWTDQLREHRVWARRRKIEAAPWNAGVPQNDAEPHLEGRYFEHHVKLLLDTDRLDELDAVAIEHGAHTSRNARRVREDGRHERFVTLRCFDVGLLTATAHLDALDGALDRAGFERLEAETEYVMFDSALGLDADWLPDAARRAEVAAGFPPVYRAVSRAGGVRQEAVFDPALRQFRNAYMAGEPVFDEPELGALWRDRRRDALNLAVRAIARSACADRLVLRGGMTMQHLCGDAAREPHDIDFLATVGTGREVVDEIVAAIAAIDDPVIRFGADAVIGDIWTYERADGRRAVITWHADGVPSGVVQIDVVFDAAMPLPAERFPIPGTDDTIASASAQLSLAWKIMWLDSDMYPRAKDLYDAVLLAERTTIDPDLVDELVAANHDPFQTFDVDSILGWQFGGGENVGWAKEEVEALKIRFHESLRRNWPEWDFD